MRPYDLAKSIFLSALELPPAERAAFVREECTGDDALLADVESLLAHHDATLAGLDVVAEAPMPTSLGAYRIERELGHGGMGVVYLGARDGGPPVAIKALRPGLLSPTLLARFKREAAALSRLDHPGIARLVETGVDEGPGGPRPWLAMEFIEGADLRTWAAGEHTAAERLALMADIADAVQHAHDNGVVHRDLKPENLFVRPDGRPVVLDFGVARLADADLRVTTVLTQVGLLVGTIRYMSPEQAEARPDGIGPASDVYALGVLTYEMLTGRLPYEMPEDSVHRALVAVMTAAPRPMQELPAPLRRHAEQLLLAALAKDPEQRLASAGAFAADLRRIAAGRAPLSRAPRATGAATGMIAGVPWRPMLALAAVAMLVGVALSTWRTPPTPLDWAHGLLQPTDMFHRTLACIDSASVRLHYTTRTLAREREALVFTQRARALARTIGWRAYGPAIMRLATFRQGEAEYLIAERTNDVARYEAASRLWYASRPVPVPLPAVAIPDTSGPSASYLLEPASPAPWLSASMALTDAARLARPAELERKALDIALEGERAFAPASGIDDSKGAREQASYIDARVGVCMVGLGYHNDDPAMLRAGIGRLRRALVHVDDVSDHAAQASHLHELGVGEVRLASMERDPALLDSARVHLTRAYDIRASLDGYTSRYLTRLELAQAERLAARLDPAPGAAARHLDAASGWLEADTVRPGELGHADATLFTLATLALEIDRACVSRDTMAFGRIRAELVTQQRTIDRTRAPLLLLEAGMQRARLEGVRYAITADALDQRHARQQVDFEKLLLAAVSSQRWHDRVDPAADRLESKPRPYDLDYPIVEPF